ncbi:MAG TPA: DAK2 domain-containing protein [Candidatus Anaerobutyricum stercoris]|uniref:DAK2 domain-containing protein n=1 Tax=Candidatus Anaerobutyricum stercoris TaxID=2838457 RepID=A0A9D2EN71_9FIRM|nr:DAK2 domain-containing protein [Eubacterium sp. An3]OUO29400.1 dihydroxyacetone kinase [Eubacterium sp. An3]HIZ40495.1 DAK2 domain-containing protein [Candidatus Anaerobutyricum stercoris]
MDMHTIDAKAFQKLFLAGANRINEQKEYINELNVFPVPDGDTGTNMSLTILSAAKEVEKISNPTIASLCKAISGGSLRGARGNSGVILSQLFRGFTKSVSKADGLGKKEIAAGFNRAVETAYKAVMKPKEGTILTVARGMAERAAELAETDLELIPYCEEIVSFGYEVLSKTPEMLPVLKEAGVVDSGGQGLMEVLQGVLDALTGKVTEIVIPEGPAVSVPVTPAKSGDYVPPADIKFGYCTEFIIMLNKPLSSEEEKELKEYFLGMGDSLVLVADEDICKVHVHTNHPGQAFEKALTYGPLSNMKVDNMRLEHEEKLIKDAEKVAARQREEEALAEEEAKKEPPKKIGFIAVSIGDGLSEIFKDLGVDYLIEGGQTMNPSTEDMLEAIDHVNAENIFILPNNKNIVLAAEQAAKLTAEKNIIVLPTKTIPQGIAAMVGYMPEVDVEENKDGMTECYQNIMSGQVTYAVRDTTINGKTIRNGDIMGIDDEGIRAVGTDVAQTTLDLLSQMVDADSELISLYYGENVTGEQAEELAAKVEEMFPDVEIETNFGGQPIYYYMVSVE